MGFLGWVYLVCRFEGYFHVGPEIVYNGDERALIKTLEQWPQDQVLPIVLFRAFSDARPPFKFGLIRAKRSGNGWGVNLIYAESDLTRDLLNVSAVLKTGFLAWAPEEAHVKVIQEAFKLSDKLTRWLRGDVGWTAGPKQDVALHDMLTGFLPQYRREPLTPEMLVQNTKKEGEIGSSGRSHLRPSSERPEGHLLSYGIKVTSGLTGHGETPCSEKTGEQSVLRPDPTPHSAGERE